MRFDQALKYRDDDDVDDDFEDDLDEDTDQDPDFEDYEDSDDPEQQMVTNLCRLFRDKFHLRLPPDCSRASFIRDLYAAAHGHPGIELIDDTGSMDDAGDEEDEDLDDTGGGRMSHGRRESVLDEVLANVSTTLAERSRGGRVLDEVLHNCRGVL